MTRKVFDIAPKSHKKTKNEFNFKLLEMNIIKSRKKSNTNVENTTSLSVKTKKINIKIKNFPLPVPSSCIGDD